MKNKIKIKKIKQKHIKKLPESKSTVGTVHKHSD